MRGRGTKRKQSKLYYSDNRSKRSVTRRAKERENGEEENREGEKKEKRRPRERRTGLMLVPWVCDPRPKLCRVTGLVMRKTGITAKHSEHSGSTKQRT
jgi:hypothetical protein